MAQCESNVAQWDIAIVCHSGSTISCQESALSQVRTRPDMTLDVAKATNEHSPPEVCIPILITDIATSCYPQ